MSSEFTRKSPITHRRKSVSIDTGSKNSTSPPISNAKPIPNYLKPPAFSCHDACKYGHGHGSESKWRSPVRPKPRGNSGIRGVVLNPELRVSGKKDRPKREDVVNGNIAQQKEDVFVDKEATFVENVAFDVPRGRIEIDIPEVKVFELSGASSVREIKMSDEEPSVNSSPVPNRDVSVPLPEDSSEDSLSMKVAVSHSDGMCDDALTSEFDVVVEIPPKDKSENMVEVKKNVKVTRTDGSELGNGKKGETGKKNIKGEKDDKGSLKPNLTGKRDTVPKDGTLTKPGATIQPRSREKTAMALTNKPQLWNNNSTRPVKPVKQPVREGEIKVMKPVKQPVLVKPTTKSPRKLKKGKGLTSHLGNSSSNSGGSIPNSENTKEKTIYMIEDKQEVSPHSQLKKVTPKGKLSNTSSSSVSERSRTSTKKVVAKTNTKPPLPPHKMAFRRGKVIDVQGETNVPTRIKFRHATSGNMINKGEGAVGATKVARRRRESGSFGVIQSTPPTGTPSVVLRHQDTPQDKNGAIASLFNHVIEETASKLVEARKSKVKALVGAFETVISLQEKSSVCSSP